MGIQRALNNMGAIKPYFVWKNQLLFSQLYEQKYNT